MASFSGMPQVSQRHAEGLRHISALFHVTAQFPKTLSFPIDFLIVGGLFIINHFRDIDINGLRFISIVCLEPAHTAGILSLPAKLGILIVGSYPVSVIGKDHRSRSSHISIQTFLRRPVP